MRALTVSVLLVSLFLVGCSDSSDDSSPGTFPPPGDGSAPSTSASPPATDEPPAGSTTPDPGSVRLVEVAEVESPIALATDPTTGDVYVAERAGRVVALADGEVGRPILDISESVTTEGFEQGLLGLAIDPGGTKLYLSYSDVNGDTQIDAYDFEQGVVDEASRRAVFSQEQPFANHNGGNIVFGPDGYLYLGLGDGGAGGDPRGAGQDPGTLLGKILRIDPDGDEPYAVPAGNPFADGDALPEIWLYGVRNPWRFSFDRVTGDLWVGDVGQNEIEEVTFLPAVDGVDAGRGANLGWSEMEGSSPYEGGEEPPNHVGPVHEYANDGARCSVTGGYVYRGAAIADLEGLYVYGDYCEGELRYLQVVDGVVTSMGSLGVSVSGQSLVSFGEDGDGELYVLAMGDDRVYRLEPS